MAMMARPREPEEFNPYTPPLSAEPGRGGTPLAEGVGPVTSVKYRLMPDDIREALRGLKGAVLLTRELKFLLFFPGFIAVIMILGVILNFLASQRPGERPRPGQTEVIVVCGMAGALLGLVVILWKVRKGKGAESPDEITATIAPDGLRIYEGDNYESKTSWSRINEIRETPNLILLLIRAFDPLRGKERVSMTYAIPRRAFTTPEAAASFLETARRWHAEAIAAKPAETGSDTPNFLTATDHGGDPVVDRNQ
jgi:hypothetical protein